MVNIYVGNLPYSTTDAELAELFTPYGPVDKATIVNDRETGRSRGFGFVEMSDREAGIKAIEELNAEPYNGRPLTVNEARPRGGGNRSRSNAGQSSHPRQARNYEPVEGSRGYSNQA